ncbi:MAG: hypothetical protein EPO61_10150 [Nitrospirae bacterium]|nr:MAG: hypothetical protein EPO61_10150 [Nitrospirota bacterium]
MGQWNADKFWQWSMGLALPVAIGSACADRLVLETLTALWADLTSARLTFLLSSTFLLVGFARNSARLRALVENRAATVPASSAPRQESSRASVLEPCND